MSCNVGNFDKTQKNHHNRSGKSLQQGLERLSSPPLKSFTAAWGPEKHDGAAILPCLEEVWATFLQQNLQPKVFCGCPVSCPTACAEQWGTLSFLYCGPAHCPDEREINGSHLWPTSFWRYHLYNHMIGYLGRTPSRSPHDWAAITQIYSPNEVTQSGWGN